MVPSTSVFLPLRFVLTGLFALFLGVGVLAVRPDLLATYHYNQYVVAVTHLLVLGWICSVVMGAMYQLVPVALETKLYSERLASWQFLFHVVGVVGMVWMFWNSNLKQVGHFGSVLTVGVGLFVYNIFRTLLRVPRWNLIASGVAAALGWLTLAVLAGLTIATGKCSYDSGETQTATGAVGALIRGLHATAGFVTRFNPLSAMHAHAHLGTVGVYLMLIVGISYKLVPMFTLSEVQNRARASVSLVLLNAGLIAAFFAILIHSPWKWACALALVSALAVYAVEIVAILRARKRRALDWGMKYFLTALGLLVPLALLGLVLAWPRLPFTAFTGQLENLYGFLGILGMLTFAIIGMLYKIVPFLVWYHSYSSRIGTGKVPSLAALYSRHWQQAGYFSYLSGLLVVGVGIVISHGPTVRWGSVLLCVSLFCLAVNVAKMLTHLVWPKFEPFQSKTRDAVPAQPSGREMLSVA